MNPDTYRKTKYIQKGILDAGVKVIRVAHVIKVIQVASCLIFQVYIIDTIAKTL
jgi:hypothetical protein